MVGKDVEELGLPTPQINVGDRLSKEMLRQPHYDMDQLAGYVSAKESLLVANQRAACNAIFDLVNRKTTGIFFLDAPSGKERHFLSICS